jgi:hypothetical protein
MTGRRFVSRQLVKNQNKKLQNHATHVQVQPTVTDTTQLSQPTVTVGPDKVSGQSTHTLISHLSNPNKPK